MSDPGVAPPRRARLELLVRKPEDEGFEVRQFGSATAFVQSRPQRVSPESFELAAVPSPLEGQQRYILKNTATDRFLVLNEPEKFLWEQMDGQRSLQEIATAYVLRYGQFDFDIIPALMSKLQRAQLLVLTPTSRLRRALARNRRRRVVKALEHAVTGLERINVSSQSVHGFFSGLYRWGGFLLFTPAALVGCAALAVIGVIAGAWLWGRADAVFSGFHVSPVTGFVSVKLLFFLTIALHQAVHALALVHYRRRVREFGFTFLHGFVPTFYVDVTDIFMASRRARVVTAVSGALVHLVLGALWFVAAVAAPTGSFLQAFAAASGLIQWQALVIALYPFCFIEMDGYHVLVDVLGVPTLRSDAFAFTGALLRGRASWALGRMEALWLGYIALSTVSVIAFVVLNVWLIAHATS